MNVSAAIMLFAVFGLLFALSVPVSVALGAASIATALVFQSFPLVMVPQRMYGALNSWTLLAIPFFVLASTIIAES